MSPIKLLQKELNELEHSLEKSRDLFKADKIDEALHQTHVNNLVPKIREYKFAIILLNRYFEIQ